MIEWYANGYTTNATKHFWHKFSSLYSILLECFELNPYYYFSMFLKYLKNGIKINKYQCYLTSELSSQVGH